MNYWTDDQMRSIDCMLNPRSIAVVGATPKGSYGGRFINAVLKSRDRVRVYPVNPNYPDIGGAKCYESVAALPEGPDLVAVIVPYQRVMDVLKESHAKGTRAAIVISSGFAERATEEGRALQRELGAFARDTGLRISGPNCLGVANVKDDIWPTASSVRADAPRGHIGLVCQSGATAFGPFVIHAVDNAIGYSYIISTGNEADLDFADYVRYLVDDASTKVIAGFVEGFKDVRKFLAVATLAAQRGKPIVLIKIGRSEAGARAASSHTASLTGEDRMYDAAFRQHGIIRAQDYDELMEISHLLAHSRRPVRSGVAIVSHSGGISSLTADMCGQAGLELPPLTPRARDGIQAILKGFGSAANPADVTGYARSDSFPRIMDLLIEEPDAGTLVIASRGAANQADQVTALRDRTEKNIVFLWTGSRADATGLAKLKAAHIPVFYSPEKMARGIACLTEYHAWRERWTARGTAEVPDINNEQNQVLAEIRSARRGALSEAESKRAIAAWGIASNRELRAPSPDAAVACARTLGYPVVVKVDSPDIPHKTEAGAVRLDLRDEQAVRAACEKILANAKAHAPAAHIDGVLVQEMVTGGVEMIAGIQYDPQLGPMLLFGTGGVMVEVYDDVALRRCPVTRDEARDMIGEVRGAKLLDGFRGAPKADVEALADALVRLSHLAVHLEGVVAEIDVNPLMVLPAGQGVKAVDALVVLKR